MKGVLLSASLAGGFATVRAGVFNGSTVAVKLLLPKHAPAESRQSKLYAAQFVKEAVLLKALQHP